MADVDAEELVRGLVGWTIPTISGKPNTILGIEGDQVLVRTRQTDGPRGSAVPLSEIQAAADRLYEEGELRIHPNEVGYRSAFLGAILSTLEDVEALRRPARLRVRVIQPPARNPTWSADELILALDLYFRRGLLSDTDPEVVQLSEILNGLPLEDDRSRDARYRNPNGVAMKLGNFARLDPEYPGTGLSRGGKGEEVLWERYANDRESLHRLADQLRAAAADRDLPSIAAEGEEEATEGRILFRRHRVRERDRRLVRKKKAVVREETGTLRCEVCRLDAFQSYGDLGESIIECHHLLPLAEAGTRTTRLADLALVCRSCHAAIHAGGVTRSLDEVRTIFRTSTRRG